MILFILCSCEEILFKKRSHFWFTPCMLNYNVNIIQFTHHPSKHARSDLDVFWLWPIMTIMTSMQPESGWIIYGLDGPVRVWPNTSGLKVSWYARLIGPSFWQDTTGPLLVSHFQTQLSSSTNIPDNIIQHQPSSDLVLSDYARFWPNGSSLEASQCAKIIQPTSAQCFPADPDQMWIGSSMFPGMCTGTSFHFILLSCFQVPPKTFSCKNSEISQELLLFLQIFTTAMAWSFQWQTIL